MRAGELLRDEAPRSRGGAAGALGMEVMVASSVRDAVETARLVVPEDGLVVVTGSLYVVAEARAVLVGSAAAPAPPTTA